MVEGDRVRTTRGEGTVVAVAKASGDEWGEIFPAAVWVELDDIHDPLHKREWFSEEVTKL